MHILSGNIGGTNARLQFSTYESGKLTPIAKESYASQDYMSVVKLVETFMADIGEPIKNIDRAGFAVAGPILKGRVQLTNLPWIIDERHIKEALGIEKVRLLNDFRAIGYGIDALDKDGLCILQEGILQAKAPRAIMGAGTGLGVALMSFSETGYHVMSTEGGHVDFAPTDDEQIHLLQYMRRKYHRVSSERLLSGQGLVAIYRFMVEHPMFNEKENQALHYEMTKGDIAASIHHYAVEHRDPLAMRAMNMFVRIYAAQVGNLALTTLPYGGFYIAGGIAPKILSQLQDERFLAIYKDKGRMAELLARVPLFVILDNAVELKGAALFVARNN